MEGTHTMVVLIEITSLTRDEVQTDDVINKPRELTMCTMETDRKNSSCFVKNRRK